MTVPTERLEEMLRGTEGVTPGRAYYNEIDPAAVAVLTQLIADGVIADGDVDTRSIKDVQPNDLDGYTQCHFFAGGGLWSVAARLAGWPDERPLWTGSCPCQPFSAAGKGRGTDDPRHLWPDFHRLIGARRPAIVMGEQVAGASGYGWLDGVRADLASEGYASRGVDIPACSVDAPHQRNRLYWVAVGDPASGSRPSAWRPEAHYRQTRIGEPREPDASGDVDHRVGTGLEGYTGHGDNGGRPEPDRSVAAADVAGATIEVADDVRDRDGPAPRYYRSAQEAPVGVDGDPPRASVRAFEHHGRNGSAWADADWIACHDGKARRAKPGLRLLVDGLPGRVDLWRVGGNAIVPILAAEVIGAYLDAERFAA